MENNTIKSHEETSKKTGYSDNEILFANNKLLSNINSKLAWVVFLLALPYVVSILLFFLLPLLGFSLPKIK